MIPSAVQEMVLRYFGSGAHPDYSRTLSILGRDPYRAVRDALAERWDLFDLTDPNSDLGVVYSLINHPRNATVRLSFVGPYSFVHDTAGGEVDDDAVLSLLAAEGFLNMPRATLDQAVTYWEPEAYGTLYEFIFEFDRGAPWRR